MKKIKDYSLYLIITEEYARGRDALEIAKSAIKGGVDVIQLREKKKSREEIIQTAKLLSALCKKSGVIFIVNDDPYIAKEAGADGVHLGQEDLARFPLDKVRDIIDCGKIAGVSTHSIEQFKEANTGLFDYISFGPIFPTRAKNYSIGMGHMGDILKTAASPVFFIGGINSSNMDQILKKGGRNIALIRAILEADDIEAMTKELKNRMEG